MTMMGGYIRGDLRLACFRSFELALFILGFLFVEHAVIMAGRAVDMGYK